MLSECDSEASESIVSESSHQNITIQERTRKADLRGGHQNEVIRKSWVWLHFNELTSSLVECNFCSKKITLNGTNSMRAHLRTHNIFEGEKRDEPQNSFEDFKIVHIESETKFETKPAMALQQDEQDGSEAEAFLLTCDLCDKAFSERGGLIAHMTNHKLEEKLLRCEECSLRMRNPKLLQLHLATDHGRNKGPVDCPICFKNCQDNTALRSHFYVHTMKRDKVLCGM